MANEFMVCGQRYRHVQFVSRYKFEDISDWDVSQVETMSSMFQGASSFNGNLSSWNVSKVSDMSYMFWDAASFEGGGLAMWDISSIKVMSGMFYGASSFNMEYVHGGDNFPYDSADDIFRNSSCTFQNEPLDDQRGPFCASSCVIDAINS